MVAKFCGALFSACQTRPPGEISSQTAPWQPDHKSFLQVHKPDFFADELEGVRPIVTRVIQNRREEKGFEVGKYAIVYRVERPVFYEGEIIRD